MLKCHCANSSEIGTSIINDVGRQAAQKKTNENTRFLVKSHQTTFYTHDLQVYINFQCKNDLSKKNHQNQQHYTL